MPKTPAKSAEAKLVPSHVGTPKRPHAVKSGSAKLLSRADAEQLRAVAQFPTKGKKIYDTDSDDDQEPPNGPPAAKAMPKTAA